MASQPQSEGELVDVFQTQEESEAFIVRGLLESAGIPALVSGFDAPQDVLPGVGGVSVRVAASQADEARQLIQDYRREGPQAADEEEMLTENTFTDDEEPPASA